MRTNLIRSPLAVLGVGTSILLAAVLLMWPRWRDLFVTEGFMPHGHCYLWIPQLVRLHLFSDLAIGASYIAISATLAWLVHRARRDMPFSWMFLAFGGFIISCGATHLVAIWNIWNASYWLSGNVKLITAVASVFTAFALPPLVPKAVEVVRQARLSLRRKEELEIANRELSDLNERIRAADELKTQMFANVSHELRTPLTLILGPLERMLQDPSLSDEHRRQLNGVQGSARALLGHVNDLLDVAKLDAGRMTLNTETVDLSRLVRRVAGEFETLATLRGIQLGVSADLPVTAQVDGEKVERILLNLLSNAFKFTPDGGKVRISVDAYPDEVVLTVADSGPGVPEDARELIFERFRQLEGGIDRPRGGTGLGLSIVRELVEIHGGTVRAETAEEGGARFRVSLPYSAPELPARPVEQEVVSAVKLQELPRAPFIRDTASTRLRTEPARGNVLIAEDNPDLREFMCETLATRYEVVAAADGGEALEKARESAPDLIITDLMMSPVSGDELVDRLREVESLSHIPVMVISARADDELMLRLLREGVQDYLVKPVRTAELLARADNLIAIKKTRELLRTQLQSQTGDLVKLGTELSEVMNALQQTQDDLRGALVRAEEANRAKDEFLAMLSHELRTPLTALRGWISLLQSGELGEDEFRNALDTIENSTQIQIRLVSDILDVSRAVTGKLRISPRLIDLRAPAADAVNVMRAAAEAKHIRIEFDADLPVTVKGDPDRLQQVVWNLVANAVKFTPEGGNVTVSVRRREGSAEVEVRDDGAGIPTDFLPHVFVPFRQADSSARRYHGGLGLGLAIVRHIMDLHGGRVTASSEGPGKGATFTAALPSADAQ